MNPPFLLSKLSWAVPMHKPSAAQHAQLFNRFFVLLLSYYTLLFWTGTSSLAAVMFKSKNEVKDDIVILFLHNHFHHIMQAISIFARILTENGRIKITWRQRKVKIVSSANFKLYLFPLSWKSEGCHFFT